MQFKRIKLNYFGRFHEKEINFTPGINLIYGDNEAGKTTIHTFLKGMLFGIERLRGRASKDDQYSRYLPWEYPGAFGGSMDIECNGKEYRLQRSFHANDKSFTITDLATGREIKCKEGNITGIIPALTESAFRNTVSIEQLKTSTDAELASQVRNYITNLSVTKSKEVNVSKAVSSLMDKKKQLESTQLSLEIKALQEEIEEGNYKEEKADTLTLQLRTLLNRENELKIIKEELRNKLSDEEIRQMEQLPAILEKYRLYKETINQQLQLEQKKKELQDKVQEWEEVSITPEAVSRQIKEFESLREEKADLEEKQKELQKAKETYLSLAKKKYILFCGVPAICLSILSFIVTGFAVASLGAAIILILLASFGYYLFSKKTAVKRSSYDNMLVDQECKITLDTKRMAGILNENKANSIAELASRQESLLKQQFAMEHAKEQYRELEKRMDEIEDSRDLLYEAIMKYMQFFIHEDSLDDMTIQRLREEIKNKRLESAVKLEEAERDIKGCSLQMEKLRWELQNLEGNEERLLRNKEKLKELQQKQQDRLLELEAVKLALSTIEGLSSEIHDSFGLKINHAVSDIIGEITGNRYTDIKVDEKLDLKAGYQGVYIPFDKLSAGTIDQLYFSLRLAVADLLLGSDEVPLILDDSFALYDEIRVRAALGKLSKRQQCILFSCHKREQELLEEMKFKYHYISLD